MPSMETKSEKIDKIKNATNERINYLLSLKNNKNKSLKFLKQFCVETNDIIYTIINILNYAPKKSFKNEPDAPPKNQIREYISEQLKNYPYLLMQDRWLGKGCPIDEFYNGLSDLNKEFALYGDIYRVIIDQNFDVINKLLDVFVYLDSLGDIGTAPIVGENENEDDLDLVLIKQDKISYVPVDER